jgi:hypothetical protein
MKTKIDKKKLIRLTESLVHDLEISHRSCTATECTTEEITLRDGRKAQIKVVVNCDENDFDEVAQ